MIFCLLAKAFLPKVETRIRFFWFILWTRLMGNYCWSPDIALLERLLKYDEAFPELTRSKNIDKKCKRSCWIRSKKCWGEILTFNLCDRTLGGKRRIVPHLVRCGKSGYPQRFCCSCNQSRDFGRFIDAFSREHYQWLSLNLIFLNKITNTI